jgi:hypothetical protein
MSMHVLIAHHNRDESHARDDSSGAAASPTLRARNQGTKAAGKSSQWQ